MLWHWMVFLSLLVFSLVEQFTKLGKKRAQYISLTFVCFFIFMATIRWNQTLGDWQGYYKIFSQQHIGAFPQLLSVKYWAFEPFYLIIMRFIKYATGSYTLLLFFMAFIAIGGFYRASVYINKERTIEGVHFGTSYSSIITTFFIFFSTCCANIYTVRTNMAMAICMLSIKYIEEKKLFYFFITVLIASMFHFVSIIFFIAYPLYTIQLELKHFLGLAIIALIVSTVGLQKIIPLIGILGGRYAEKVASYNIHRGGENLAYLSYSGTTLIIRALSNTIFILVILFYFRRYFKSDKRFNGLFNIYVMGAFLQGITISFNIEFARLATFFTSTQFFLLPYVVKRQKTMRNGTEMYFAGLVVYMVVKLYSLIHSSPEYGIFPSILI